MGQRDMEVEPMYVICFYWEGDRWSRDINSAKTNDPAYISALQRVGDVSLKLASKYVNSLYFGVKRFATRPFDFICFTNEELDVNAGIELREFPLITDQGVLPRVYMFSPEAGLGNRQVLCLDLDVVVVGSLKKLMAYNGLFCTRTKFRFGEEHKLDGDIMSFRAGDKISTLFWTPFITDVEAAVEMTQGRERYWVRHVANDIADRWDSMAPGAVVSYKKNVMRRGEIPKQASIVSCHGYPRPHQIKDYWIKDYWG